MIGSPRRPNINIKCLYLNHLSNVTDICKVSYISRLRNLHSVSNPNYSKPNPNPNPYTKKDIFQNITYLYLNLTKV